MGSETAQAREAALREILGLISRSREDAGPVFDAILHLAADLCGAFAAGLIMGRPGDRNLRMVAHFGISPATVAVFDRGEVPMDPETSFTAQAIQTGRTIHVEDMMDTESYRKGIGHTVSVVQDSGIRTNLLVPLVTPAGAIGAFIIFRKEVRPYTPDEIALVETFAAQAVIAIENVRQFHELQERLEREKASGEILSIISGSRDDEAPVFDAILESASRLCGAESATLMLVDEARTKTLFRRHHGRRFRLDREGQSWPLDTGHPQTEAARTGQTVHVADLKDSALYRDGDPVRVALVDEYGARTILAMPMMRGDLPIGVIILRRMDVARPFSEGDIRLVETFAAQAVIAIENVHQFRELQVRLEREAATRQILEVISQSRDDEGPVFDSILQNIARLCDISLATLNRINHDGTHLEYAAHWGVEFRTFDLGHDRWPLDSTLQIAQSVREARTIHTPDLADTDLYRAGDPVRRRVVDDEGVRSYLTVPLITAEGKAIGCIGLYRQRLDPFTADGIALVETFAAQAVIAIENVRQFRELRTRLEREAATREILQVISQSRDDDRPVFDMIAQRAAVLCGAAVCTFWRVEDGLIHYCASHGLDSADFAETRSTPSMPLLDTTMTGRVVNSRAVVQIEDAFAESYHDHEWAQRLGLRQLIGVPIFVGDEVWGCINLMWRADQVRGVADIQLVESFADQASIAIENVRQFRELQARLAREAATREILEVISQSRDDEAPVFDAVLRKAAELCGAPLAGLNIISEDRSHAVMVAHWGETLRALVPGKTLWPLDADLVPSIAMREGRIVQERDLADTDGYRSGEPVRRQAVDEEGIRTIVVVPIFIARRTVGSIALYRREVRPFTPDEIALVETFAAQAVIAIENVRQFRALQDRLEREAATRNILRVISESPDDEQPTFEAILDSATRLCGTPYASLVLGRRGDASQRMVAHRAAMAETLAFFREGKVPMDPEDSIGARAILEGRTIHVPDMADTDQYRAGHARFRVVVDQQGLRTNLFVPLLGPEGGIGCIILWKKEVAPFTADQVALMETFASHAVIAIENVRQFKALERLNAELGDRVQAQVGEIERMGRLKRFLPAAVADTVISTGSEKLLSSHRALLGVLFCDIRGFTAFCETAEPEETIEVLQTYHEEMGRLIEAHGAGVDHRMGDGIMVLFNDPLPCEDPAGDAVRLAVAMRARMVELCVKWKRLGHRLGFGVGVALGYATVGMVGAGGRTDYTASGTAINLASRLCDEAQDGEILLSPRARLAVEDDFAVEPRGEIAFKGIREPVEVFRLVGVVSA